MRPVGIIANPMSGKDIRRIVASGLVVGNHEKANIVVRVLKALDALGISEAVLMPDGSGLAKRIIQDTQLETTELRLLDVPYTLSSWKDTAMAAEMMSQQGFACIITLGGDGTNRITAKACGDTPLIPISTGTNNVFPEMIEGTIAGLAAGLVASGAVRDTEVCRRAPMLELLKDGHPVDNALIDLVVLASHDVGSRAVWETESIKELFLADIRSNAIGLSAIGARLGHMTERGENALHIETGEAGEQVLAPLAPGLIDAITVSHHHIFSRDQVVPINNLPGVAALDGEREVVMHEREDWAVRLSNKGPRVIDVNAAMRLADERKAFTLNDVKSLTQRVASS